MKATLTETKETSEKKIIELGAELSSAKQMNEEVMRSLKMRQLHYDYEKKTLNDLHTRTIEVGILVLIQFLPCQSFLWCFGAEMVICSEHCNLLCRVASLTSARICLWFLIMHLTSVYGFQVVM